MWMGGWAGGWQADLVRVLQNVREAGIRNILALR